MKWVIAGAHALDSPLRVSAGRLARYLSMQAGNEVLYLASPFDVADLVRGVRNPRVRERARLWPVPRSHSRTLSEYAPLSPLLGPAGSRWGARLAPTLALRLTTPRLSRVLLRSGFDRPDVLVVSNLRFADLDRLIRPRLLLYRAVDDIRGFTSAAPGLAVTEEALLRRAGLCIATSSVLAEVLESRGARRAHVVRHGSDLPAELTGPEPARLRDIPRPRVLYVGALNERINVSWIESAARALPDTHFVLVGPKDDAVQLTPRRNLHLTGELPPDEVDRYTRAVDAAIIPFVRSPLVESTCPIKLYAFLAAGLPVVATRTLEMTRIGAPVSLVDTEREFITALEAAPRSDGRDERIAFARQHTWERGFEEIRRLARAALEEG